MEFFLFLSGKYFCTVVEFIIFVFLNEIAGWVGYFGGGLSKFLILLSQLTSNNM